jgi:hypothetical protein
MVAIKKAHNKYWWGYEGKDTLKTVDQHRAHLEFLGKITNVLIKSDTSLKHETI